MKLILAMLGGALLGVGGYTFWYGQGLSYVSNDPAACVNCHIMNEHYAGWQKASHHSVAPATTATRRPPSCRST